MDEKHEMFAPELPRSPAIRVGTRRRWPVDLRAERATGAARCGTGPFSFALAGGQEMASDRGVYLIRDELYETSYLFGCAISLTSLRLVCEHNE